MTSPVQIPIYVGYNIKIPNLDKELEISYDWSQNERIIISREDRVIRKERIIIPSQYTFTPIEDCDEEKIVESFHYDDVEYI